jgi:hypothetical protein
VSLRRTLDVMGTTLERASSFPLSASCMVNRAEMLSLVERARAELPVELDEAAALLVAHQDVIARAEDEAGQVLARAQVRAEQMLEDSALVATARGRSEQILHAARSEAARLLREADEYCDGRLALFENDLERAMAQVRRGRDRLRERSNLQTTAQHADDAERVEPAHDEPAYDESARDESAYDDASAGWTDEQSAEWAAAEAARTAEAARIAEAARTNGRGGPTEGEGSQPGEPARGTDDELVHAQAGGPGERRIVDLAGMERGAAERSGLGQRVNLQ